ncbi:hypothetical protein BC829DRAFT_426391 [Chytridium lagenaria]|nr:hypothetical protein BC829DRAFT_426391 [Chytridium lagenaria]
MCILYILQQIDYDRQRIENRNPPSSILPGVSECQGNQPYDPCISIMYARPTDIPKGIYTAEMYDGIMSKFSRINNVRFEPQRKLGIVPIPTADFLYDYVLLHPNTTNWGVIFRANDSEVTNIQYEIWYNASQTLNDTDVIGRTLVSLMRGLDEAIISHLNYPDGEVLSNINITMKDWPLVPALVVSDRIVQTIGPVFFFCTTMVIFINIINNILTEKELKLRHAMQMMGLKHSSHRRLYSHPHFFLYGESMLFLAFFITTQVRRARVGVLVGIFIFIVGSSFNLLSSPETTLATYGGHRKLPNSCQTSCFFSRFSTLEKVFLDVTSLTTGKLDTLTSTYIPDLYKSIPTQYLPVYPSGATPLVPPPVQAIYLFLANIAIYGTLTWYSTASYPMNMGMQPSEAGNTSEMRIVNIRKVYSNSAFRKTKIDKVAVKSLCMTMRKGNLLALLGQNGAGKSTTMNILSGLTRSTAGDAHIFGYSVSTQIEHILLYAGLKGIAWNDIAKLVDERLESVKLSKVRDNKAATYSGGMKRRLSMVISTIGDPKIIYLDEPTTGMDPVNRRHVWSFIENFKKDRVIILTTHSMEEADILGDRIAVMSHGRLRAIGSSLSLKKKYGAGYRVSLVVDPERIEEAKREVNSRIPSATMEDDSAGALIYQFTGKVAGSVPRFIKYLEENPEGFVKAWGISQTTLEVIIRGANADEKAKATSTSASKSQGNK